MSDVSTTKFSMIPKWVMISDLSSGAIRLYGVLMCYADNKTHEAYPSRKTLADDMQLKRVRSVDTYIEELVEFGALIVNKRKRKDGSYMSSLYTLIFDKSTEQVLEEPEGVVLKNALPSAPDVTVTTLTQLNTTRTSEPSSGTDEAEKTAAPRTRRVRAALSLQDQLHIDEDTADHLLQLAYRCWHLGDDGPWTDLEEDLQDAAGIDCVDGMVWDYGFRERLDCIMRDTQAEGKSVRYGLSEWICTLTHTTRATA